MKSGKVLLGVLAGFAAGAMLGILFAPDKGESTRKKISKKGQKYADELRYKTDEFADKVSQKVQHVKDEVQHVRDQGSRVAESWKQKAKDVEADLKRKV